MISKEIPITEEIIKKIKSLTNGFHTIIDIRPTDNVDLYNIDYVEVNFWKDNPPEFRYSTLTNINLKSEVRDMKIEYLLKYVDIESVSREYDKGLNFKEIGLIFNLSASKIYRVLKSNNLIKNKRNDTNIG